MELERFIPFLILIIIWNIITAKRKKKQSAPKTVKAKTPNLEQLLKVLTGQVKPEDLIQTTSGEPIIPPEEEADLWTTQPEPKKKSNYFPNEKFSSTADEVPEISSEPLPPPVLAKSRRNFPKQAQLRQAIIWKELLDKPLALRQNQ